MSDSRAQTRGGRMPCFRNRRAMTAAAGPGAEPLKLLYGWCAQQRTQMLTKTVRPAVLRYGSWCMSGTLRHVTNLQRRGGYTPRRVREQRAYWLAVGSGGAGVIGVVGIVLAVAGVIGAELPVIALIVAALCAWGFMRTVASR